jgi:hypothetical protein
MRVSEGCQEQCAATFFVSVDRGEARNPLLYLESNVGALGKKKIRIIYNV